jgi:septal ring factor EnvC (AmiA/AmiB activator)
VRRLAATPLTCALLLAAAASADREADLERLREAIGERRDRVERYEREERGLLEALEAIEEAARLLERDVVRTREEAQAAREALRGAESEARHVAERLARTERAMSRRAVALYRAGELGAMPMLFAAGDLRDALTRVQALRRLLAHDAELLARHRAESRALGESRERAARAAEASETARAAFEERNDQLAEERRQRRALIARLRGNRAVERTALAELETAAVALEETVASLPETAPEQGLGDAPAFESLRGSLPRPVDASIAGGFGRVVESEFQTQTFRKGVDFDAEAGQPVRAVAAGHVRYAGRFRGYGNVVILDHGSEYFTVSAHLSRIDVAIGEVVAAGERVGRVGESGSLSGPHLYFELRRGGAPLDPRRWLR